MTHQTVGERIAKSIVIAVDVEWQRTDAITHQVRIVGRSSDRSDAVYKIATCRLKSPDLPTKLHYSYHALVTNKLVDVYSGQEHARY